MTRVTITNTDDHNTTSTADDTLHLTMRDQSDDSTYHLVVNQAAHHATLTQIDASGATLASAQVSYSSAHGAMTAALEGSRVGSGNWQQDAMNIFSSNESFIDAERGSITLDTELTVSRLHNMTVVGNTSSNPDGWQR